MKGIVQAIAHSILCFSSPNYRTLRGKVDEIPFHTNDYEYQIHHLILIYYCWCRMPMSTLGYFRVIGTLKQSDNYNSQSQT